MTMTSKSHDYETVPILRILESKDLHKLIPAIGCLYVIACSAALLEVFTEAFQIVVRIATSEWKILLKQISYESRESGSPVLAIFVSGSLVAILAFACPLQNMTFVIAGAQLVAGILRAFYFLYSPFRPKSTNPKRKPPLVLNISVNISLFIPAEDSSTAYSRLETGNKAKPSISKRTSMWFLDKAPSISAHNLTKSISKLNRNAGKEELEKEWLLLGEASSPVNRPHQDALNAESSILSDSTTSDIECIVKAENSESESEEDIDSIVEEFQQKVKVSTAGLKETSLKVPSMGSWRVANLCIVSVVGSCIVAGASALCELMIPFALSVAGKSPQIFQNRSYEIDVLSFQLFSLWVSLCFGFLATHTRMIRQPSLLAPSRFYLIPSFCPQWWSTAG